MRRFLLVPGLFAFVLLGQGCLADPPQPNHPIIFQLNERAGSSDALGAGSGTTGTADALPPVKPGETASASGNVVISSVVAGQPLPNPFVILGRASSVDRAVQWRIRDRSGTEIASGAVTTDNTEPGPFGSFRVRAFYDRLPEGTNGQMEVFLRSPKTGAEQDSIRIPVLLMKETTAIKAFFVNEKRDPDLLHCEIVYPETRRIPKTADVAEAALRELLKGPTAAEQLDGARTALVPGTELRSVAIEGDTATVDFTRQFALGIAGSCRVLALRVQVEQTLKQFSGVKNVKILVEGADAEQYLQP